MSFFDLPDFPPQLSPDLILGSIDHMDCHALYGISSRGKNFIAYLQETDDVVALGNWSCRISRRDFDAYGFDLAHGRGLRICTYIQHGDRMELSLLSSNDH